MLFTTALAAEPDASVIAMGIHAGTGYRDCSPEFVSLMQSVANFHSDGRTTFVAPFVGWSKREVYDLAAALDVRVEQLHSCETADTPCGACRSCADRALLG
jgi:7-cyano-7-deazaguanine synthase in queuosine biosynthesis